MITLLRTDSSHHDFQKLVRALDAELAIYNGDQNDFYSQYNPIDGLKYTVIAHDAHLPVGSGAIKPLDDVTMEIKRMYSLPAYRGKGVATRILTDLETWSIELGYQTCVLETGTFLKAAVALYQKQGYSVIPNYGQYAGIEESVCFSKKLS